MPGTELHHTLDTGAVVPAAVKQHNLSGRRKTLDVTLPVHLGFLSFGWRRQRLHPEHAGADPFGDAFDDTAFAGRVTPLEDDNNLEPLFFDPVLQFDQLGMQLEQRRFILFSGKFGL